VAGLCVVVMARSIGSNRTNDCLQWTRRPSTLCHVGPTRGAIEFTCPRLAFEAMNQRRLRPFDAETVQVFSQSICIVRACLPTSRRDASLRVARRCASGKPICSVVWGFEAERAFCRIKTNAPLICNRTTIVQRKTVATPAITSARTRAAISRHFHWRRAWHEAPYELKASVQLRES
jgi:hypothetical protein